MFSKVRKTRSDCTVDTYEKKHDLPTGTIRNTDGRKARKDKKACDTPQRNREGFPLKICFWRRGIPRKTFQAEDTQRCFQTTSDPPSLNYTVPRRISVLKGVTDDAQRWVSEGDRHIGGDLCRQNGGRYRGQPGEHAEGGAACQRATGRQQTQAGRREHASACRA